MPRRRKTQRGRGITSSRPKALPRVFVACHTPSKHGKITWEGHEIVGYVNIDDGSAVPGDAPYYKGWDTIPASLKGTIDIVFSAYCPVVPALQSGYFTWDKPAEEDIGIGGKDTHEILTKSFALLRPGGTILFPRVRDIVHPATQEELRKHGLSVEVLENIPKPRWTRHRQEEDYDVNEDYDREVLRGIQMTRVAGGRRRYPRSSLRKSMRS